MMKTFNILNLKEVIEGIHQSIGSHSLPLFYRANAKECNLLGTAVFLELDGYYVLLTAGHVALNEDQYGSSWPIYIPTTSGIIDSMGTGVKINDENDIGFIWLPNPIGELLKFSTTPLREDQIMFEILEDDNSRYYITGYPANFIQKFEMALQANSAVFRTRPALDKVLQYHKKNRTDHLVMTWDNLVDSAGNKVKRYRPEGMSGSGLWYISDRVDFLGRHDISCKLIGIMNEYKTYKFPVLIGTPISKIINYIKPILTSSITFKK